MSNDGVKFEADGQPLTLRFGFNALCALETELDVGITELGARMADNPRLSFIRSVFAAGLAEHHPGITPERVGEIMDSIGITFASELLGKALQMAFPQAKANGAAKPGNGVSRKA